MCLILVGCGPSQPEIVDNGLPGQIKAVVFQDDNANRKMDPGEPGVVDRVMISQDTSCPPSSLQKATQVETDSNGEATFTDLKAGRYCVSYVGEKATTTKLTVEVPLSSEQAAQVIFGLADRLGRDPRG